MRVGLVRNVALGMVALVGLGLAGCDDNPTDFDPDDTTRITTNPSVMVLPAGVTTLLSSRTENAGNEPTWEEVSATVDASCGSGAITVAEAASYEPSIQPPGQFDVTGGTTLGDVCIELSGGGVSTTVEVTVVGDSLVITGAPEFLNLFEEVQLSAALLSDDGTAVSPFDPTTDLVWSSDNEDVFTVDQTGLVTSVGGVGAATITATWTMSGATVSTSVTISSNQPTLEIQNAPAPGDSLLIDTTVDLDVILVNPTDPPADFGPFDQLTDVTWSTSDAEIVSVDATTGEATAEGFGTATITVTWNQSDDVNASVDIPVDIPAPTLASATPNSGNLGDLITLTGAGFHPAQTILVDGNEILPIYEPTIVNSTTATFRIPFGADGDLSVTVGAPGQASGPVTVTRTITDATEPANNSTSTAPTVVLPPFDRWGVVDDADPDDFFAFTLAAETTFDIFLDWEGSADLDLIITDEAIASFPCFAASTAHPEGPVTCTIPAGDWILWVNSYDHVFGAYRVVVTP